MNWSKPFGIKNWAAWSPLIKSNEEWLDWSKNPFPLLGSESPKVEGMQSINRRRLKRLGSMALEATYRLPESMAPVVFCSKYGEIERGYQLLKELTETGAVSPQSFSLAVHNAIPSLYTIDRKINPNVIAISSDAGIFSALLEAQGLFSLGEEVVRIIVAEEPVPDTYNKYCEFINESYAYAIDLEPGGMLSLAFTGGNDNKLSPQNYSTNLNVLRFLLSSDKDDVEIINGARWQLRRS
jgi:hypothetical protein